MADKYRTPDEIDIRKAVQVARLICVDVGDNNNKYWNGYALANGDFYCEYGRVADAKADCRHDYYEADQLKGKSNIEFLEAKKKSKLRPRSNKASYVEQKVADHQVKSTNGDNGKGKKVVSGELKKIASDQIQGDAEVKKLVIWLAEINIHQITSHTNITYNVDTGMFTTPLGTLVTAEAITDARQLLDDMSPHVIDQKWGNRSYQRLLGDYLQLIPQDVGRGRGWHETFFAADQALQSQNDILDSLAASLQKATAAKPSKAVRVAGKKVETVFSVSLEPVRKGTAFDRIKGKYNSDKGSHYDVKDFDVYAIWTVNITTVHNAYTADGKKVGGVKQLWHGTKASNLLSILKGGLIIPPSNSSHCTGRMFGNGLYFSDQSTKAIRYATGGWGGGGTMTRVFMFMADVAMGKPFTPRGYQHGGFRVPSGYDSCFAQGSKSGVANNEMIVYRTSQADLTHLIEFKKKSRW